MNDDLKNYVLIYETVDREGERTNDQIWKCQAPDDVHAINQLLNAYEQSWEKVTVIEEVIVED